MIKPRTTNHGSVRLTQRLEGVAASAQGRDKEADGLRRVPSIRARIFMVAVMDDDDVAGRCFASEPGADRVTTRLLPPVPVPHAPAPACDSKSGTVHAGIHGDAAPSGVRTEQPAGLAPR